MAVVVMVMTVASYRKTPVHAEMDGNCYDIHGEDVHL